MSWPRRIRFDAKRVRAREPCLIQNTENTTITLQRKLEAVRCMRDYSMRLPSLTASVPRYTLRATREFGQTNVILRAFRRVPE